MIRIAEELVENLSDVALAGWFDWAVREAGGRGLRPDTAALYVAILRAFDSSGFPMTVRQMFYALTVAGAVEKTEAGYSRVGYHLLRLRRWGLIPYDWIADNTRWMRKPDSYDDLAACLENTRKTYRRALWRDQGVYVEVWCEKDALAGVISDVTEEWDVPLMVSRGFASETFLYSAAEAIKAAGRPAFVYFFGDHDPSGRAIVETVERRLREFGAVFHFEQVAVLPWQVKAWGLPTRPTKRTDSRAKGWEGESVELDAIPAERLRELVRERIVSHIDAQVWERTRRIEAQERESFAAWLGGMATISG